MPRRSYDPEAIQLAVAAVRGGRSLREVADELAELGVPVAHETVRQWCRAAAGLPSRPGSHPPVTVALEEARTLVWALEAEVLDREGIASCWAHLQRRMVDVLSADVG